MGHRAILDDGAALHGDAGHSRTQHALVAGHGTAADAGRRQSLARKIPATDESIGQPVGPTASDGSSDTQERDALSCVFFFLSCAHPAMRWTETGLVAAVTENQAILRISQ